MKIPFVLLTGFLGSGKTTLLKRMLLHTAAKYRVLVVQNEFAEANIDARELESVNRPFKVLEMNRGSVFCVCLFSDFQNSCSALIDEYKPDLVILEATGLADPVSLAQVLGAPRLKERVYLAASWCVVDASNFLKMEPFVRRMSHQVRIADRVIINKADLADTDTCTRVEGRIRGLNPFAKTDRVSFCETAIPDLVHDVTAEPAAFSDYVSSIVVAGRPPVNSAVISSTVRIGREQFETFITIFAPRAYRIKGFVNLAEGETVAVQSCFGRTEYAEIASYAGPTELVALGPEIEPGEFRDRFLQQCVG